MSEWTQETLGELAFIEIGGTPSRDVPSFWADPNDDGIPWISIADLGPRYVRESKERITQKGFLSSNSKHIPSGTLLMSFKLTIGRAGIADCDLTSNEAIAAITPKGKKLDAEFLYYQLPPVAMSAITDSAIKGSTLNKKTLAALKLSYPRDLNQQRRIAEILGTVDEVIEQTEALIAKQQQVKAGLMQDLFTRGVTPTGTLRPTPAEAPRLYQDSPLGPIPKEWGYTLLDAIAQRGSGHTPNKNHPEYWDGGIKWVSLADSWRLDRVYISETEKEISALGIANSSAVLHPPGIVVLSRDAGVGKSSITTCEMAVSQHFMCWRCGPKLDTHYLYYWLQYRKREFENIATGSTIPTIGLRYFKHYRLNVPANLKEQENIGALLLSLDQGIQAETAHLAKLRQEKQGLMQDLLTGRVPVPAA